MLGYGDTYYVGASSQNPPFFVLGGDFRFHSILINKRRDTLIVSSAMRNMLPIFCGYLAKQDKKGLGTNLVYRNSRRRQDAGSQTMLTAPISPKMCNRYCYSYSYTVKTLPRQSPFPSLLRCTK